MNKVPTKESLQETVKSIQRDILFAKSKLRISIKEKEITFLTDFIKNEERQLNWYVSQLTNPNE